MNAARLNEPPYSIAEVSFLSDKIKIAGQLFIPQINKSNVGVVFIHGSGESHSNIFWYLSQADYLAKQGLIVLLPDKRGCRKSEGTYHDAYFKDFVSDAIAGAEFLSNLDKDAPKRIGIIGISQGGWVAPQAAIKSDKIQFVISVSGSITTPSNQVKYELANELKDSGAPGFISDLISPLVVSRAKRRMPIWWNKNGNYNPVNDWLSVDKPTLLLFGRKDKNVDVNRCLEIMKTGDLYSKQNISVKLFENYGHALIDQQTSWTSSNYLEYLCKWILEN